MKKEHFRCVLVNAKGEIITVDEVSVGELSSTVVHPREVFSQAIRKSAAHLCSQSSKRRSQSQSGRHTDDQKTD